MMLGRWVRRVVLGVVVTLAACSGEDGGGDGGGGDDAGIARVDGAAPGPSCTPDPARVSAGEACRSTDTCPCGTSCVLGTCAAACSAAEPCPSGQRCDELGTCRPADDLARIPGLAATGAGRLVVTPRFFGVEDAQAPRRVTLHALGGAIAKVRASGGDGIEVDCTAGGVFAATCDVDGLAAGERRVIHLRGSSPINFDEVREASFRAGGQLETVTLAYAAPLSLLEQPSTTPAALAGVYTGNARIIGTVASNGTVTELSEVVSIPLTAELFENVTPPDLGFELPAVIVLGDPLGALHPDKKMGIGVLDWASQTTGILGARVIRGAAAFGVDSQINSFGAIAGPVVQPGPRPTVSLDYDQSFEGFHGHRTRWRVTLTRAGDLPAGASITGVSGPPYDELPPQHVRTPWEAAIEAKIRESRTELELIDNITRSLARTDAYLDACTLGWGELLSSQDPTLHRALSVLTADLLAPDRDRAVSWGSDDRTVIVRQAGVRGNPAAIDAWAPGAHPLFEPIVAQIRTAIDIGSTVDWVLHAIGAVDVVVTSPGELFTSAPGSMELPCAWHVPAFTIWHLNMQAPVPALDVDVCAEMSVAFDCEEVLPAGPTYADIRFQDVGGTTERLFLGFCPDWDPECQTRTESWSDAYVLGSSGFTLPSTIEKVCRFPVGKLAQPCLEAAACSVDGALDASFLTGRYDTATGDARCDEGERTFGFDADLVDDARAQALVRTCLRDLERAQSAPSSSAALPALLGSEGCVDVPRLLLALGVASDFYLYDQPAEGADAAGALAHRLLVRWVQLHAFLARETGSAQEVAAVLRSGSLPVEEAPVELEDLLPALYRGWDLLAANRFALLNHGPISDRVWAEPDYRARVTGVPPGNTHAEPAIALPAAIFDGLAAHLDLLEGGLRRASFTGDRAILAELGRTMRYAAGLQALAEGLHAQAIQVRPRLAWAETYARARRDYLAAAARALEVAERILLGENPFGLEPSDRPLYFLGSEQDANSRFSAISDFLVGKVPGSQAAWAPVLVSDAKAKMEAVRSAWLERKDRLVATQSNDQERAARIEEVKASYGARIIDLCGRPGTISASSVLESWATEHGRPFNPADCFIDISSPSCVIDTSSYVERITPDDVRYQFCVFSELELALPGEAHFIRRELDALGRCPGSAVEHQPSCAENAGGPCLRCTSDGSVDAVPLPPGIFLELELGSRLEPRFVESKQRLCHARFPSAQVPLPSYAALADEPPAQCLRGSLGEQALTIRSVAKDIDIARSEYSDKQQSYDIAMRSCLIRELGDQRAQAEVEKHNKTMHGLRIGKLAADIAANVAGAAKDCASAAAGVSNPFTGGSAGAACGAAAAEAAAQSVSDGLQFAMDEAQASHEAALMRLEAETTSRVCRSDAEMYLVGIRSQALRIEQAMVDLSVAVTQLNNLRAAAQLAFDDGVSDLRAEEERRLSPLSHDLWFDERVADYSKAWRLAHRATYLALRGVEYEFQQSLSVERDVLEAELPTQLEAALSDLVAVAASGGINGSRADNLKAVLSLRDDVLQLQDRSNLAPSELTLTPAERFRVRLRSPELAVYADDGRYLGQQIPFTIAPLARVGLGRVEGVSIYAGNSCAERVWSVNATVLGSAELLRGSEQTFTDLELRKSNSFFSQWCTVGEGDYQSASVRPSRNLFRDPEVGVSQRVAFMSDPAKSYASARLQASFNVPRRDFESDAYANGMTTELAARGLYGDYALFFPAATLSTLDASGQRSRGLDLSEIDDVLIRLDYVSVAR